VKDFKEKQLRKQERRKKWELYKKTQSMLWKKSSVSSKKWDYYTSSEEEKDETESEPIVPKNDPNFIAMEEDFNKRKKKKNEERAKAESLKQKANDYMKQ
jgi:hypothetical protein